MIFANDMEETVNANCSRASISAFEGMECWNRYFVDEIIILHKAKILDIIMRSYEVSDNTPTPQLR